MHGFRGNGAMEKRAFMPSPLWRSTCVFTTVDSRCEYGHGAPLGSPVGTLPQCAALGSLDFLTGLCGPSQPEGPHQPSRDAYVGSVCQCHCGADRRSRYLVHLVWVSGSFGC